MPRWPAAPRASATRLAPPVHHQLELVDLGAGLASQLPVAELVGQRHLPGLRPPPPTCPAGHHLIVPAPRPICAPGQARPSPARARRARCRGLAGQLLDVDLVDPRHQQGPRPRPACPRGPTAPRARATRALRGPGQALPSSARALRLRCRPGSPADRRRPGGPAPPAGPARGRRRHALVATTCSCPRHAGVNCSMRLFLN